MYVRHNLHTMYIYTYCIFFLNEDQAFSQFPEAIRAMSTLSSGGGVWGFCWGFVWLYGIDLVLDGQLSGF